MVTQAIQRLAAAAVCLCVCAAGAHPAAPVYRLTLIPALNGVTECHAASLNDAGQVAGTCFNGGGAFLWSEATGSQQITDPAHPDGVIMITALNNLGRVAGTRYWSDAGESHERGFVWDAGTGMTYFGDSDRFWHLTSLNDDTVAAGFRAKLVDGDYQWAAFTWTLQDGFEKLRPYAHRVSLAFDINNGGQVVGSNFDKLTGRTHAVVFEPDGSLTRIPLPGNNRGGPTAINEAGHVTGQMRASSGADHAFLWTPDAGLLDVDPRPLRTDHSRGMDVNNAGQMVGSMSWRTGQDGMSTAFYWDSSNGMLELMTRIDPSDPLLAQIDSLVWYIDDPMRINRQGQIVLTAKWVGGAILPLLLTPVP
jgi:uncharacterized membrane protein